MPMPRETWFRIERIFSLAFLSLLIACFGVPNGFAQEGVLAARDSLPPQKPDWPIDSDKHFEPVQLSQPPADEKGGSIAQSFDFLMKTIAPPKSEGGISSSPMFGIAGNQRSNIKTAATLTLIVSLFLLVMYLLRMRTPTTKKTFPTDLVSVLGQTKLGPSQNLQLIRLGTKLLLVANGQNGTHTLGEIDDPEEVLRIESSCREGNWPGLNQILHQKIERQRQQAENERLGNGVRNPAASHRTLLEA